MTDQQKKIIGILLPLLYLIAEIGMLLISVYKATQAEWLAAIWFLIALQIMRKYYQLQTTPDK